MQPDTMDLFRQMLEEKRSLGEGMEDQLKEDGYVLVYSPDRSPNDVSFSVALEFLRDGRRIKRRAWREGRYLEIVNGQIGLFTGHPAETDFGPGFYLIVTSGEILEQDWCVLPQSGQ
jgi:hypothetical protein